MATTATMDQRPPGPAPTGGGGLVRYLAAALPARGADAGAGVGLVLLAVDPATRLGNGPAVGGLLVAGLTAPHLLGPWVGRLLDRRRDGRRLLAASFVLYGVALAAAALLLGRARLPLVAALVGLAGLSGPS